MIDLGKHGSFGNMSTLSSRAFDDWWHFLASRDHVNDEAMCGNQTTHCDCLPKPGLSSIMFPKQMKIKDKFHNVSYFGRDLEREIDWLGEDKSAKKSIRALCRMR